VNDSLRLMQGSLTSSPFSNPSPTSLLSAGRFIVRPDLAPAQAVKTLAHETAHTLLHDGSEYAKGCRGRVDFEAESVAYLVCATAGIATGGVQLPLHRPLGRRRRGRWCAGPPSA
jgi:hypothetical protein